MPELPDLEVYKDNVFKRLSSKRLVGVEVCNALKVSAPPKASLAELAGRDLQAIYRSGKELYFDFGEKKIISSHLMLNGQMSIVAAEAADAIKFKIFAMRFERETLVFSDMGGLCTIKYMPSPGKAPDAFDDAFSLDYFLRVAHAKHRAGIKAFLIDQAVVKGIGNAYADEILYAALIDPRSTVGGIPAEKMEELYRAIHTVLHEAIDAIRRISPDRISGEERSFLKVHNKSLKQTATGYPIIVERIGSKITYYTKEQKLYM